jgi:hypothetical protein
VTPLVVALALLAPATTTRFALIVGNDLGDPGEIPLRWAQEDARRIHATLVSIGDVHPERAELLLDPTVSGLEERWRSLASRVAETRLRGETATLLFYYSGHADDAALHFGRELLPIARLKDMLRDAGATTTVVVIDACRNTRSPRTATKGVLRAPPFAWPAASQEMPVGFVYLTSAARGEVAQESDDLEGSLFTHHLLSGLRGAADGDADGTVTLGELYDYGYAHTLAGSHAAGVAVQHSELDVALSGRGAVVLTYPRRAEAALAFGTDVRGHLLIVDDATGRVAGECVRDSATPAILALAPGRYRVQVRDGAVVRVGIVTLAGGVRRVGRDELPVQPTYSVLAKGAAWDPFPLLVGAGPTAGTAPLLGAALGPAGAAGLALYLERRRSGVLRPGVGLVVTYATADAPLWRHEMWDVALTIGGTARLDGEPWAAGLVVRTGPELLYETGTRREHERIAAVIPDAEVRYRTFSIGPRLDAGGHVEWTASERWVLRFEATAWASLRRVDGNLDLAPGASAALLLLRRV